jgi:hypothetical protein
VVDRLFNDFVGDDVEILLVVGCFLLADALECAVSLL